jgi:hypothetical protein
VPGSNADLRRGRPHFFSFPKIISEPSDDVAPDRTGAASHAARRPTDVGAPHSLLQAGSSP